MSRVEKSEQDEQDEQHRERRRTNRLAWVVAVVVIAAVAGLAVFMASAGTKSDPRVDAGRICQEFAKQRLKAPTTASFGTATTIPHGGGWQVTNTVDAENSFGAKIRTDFVCVVHQDGTDWVLDRMIGLDG